MQLKTQRRRRIKCDEGRRVWQRARRAHSKNQASARTHTSPSAPRRSRTACTTSRPSSRPSPPAVFAAGSANDHPAPMEFPASPVAPFLFPGFGSGVPPPSLHLFPLTNPSTHFTPHEIKPDESVFPSPLSPSPDLLAEETSRLSLSASYLYFDDEGYTRWQGEASGLPLLDLLVERHVPASDAVPPSVTPVEQDWFPNRTPRRTDVNPQTLWRLITSYIAPELMDSLVQCYLSTSYYILPFLHVPSFLADYGNPQKWGEPGFAAFIVAICCLASRHMDDPRVRTSPLDAHSAGTQWFDLLGRLRTLYTIQADLIAAVYAVGLGKLSKAAALLSEAVSVAVDAGLHRSADTYDLFDPVEDAVRAHTFWCVYIWDKQLSAHFGRPPMLRLRDCDVGEPRAVDDEWITREGVGVPVLPAGTACRMAAFVGARVRGRVGVVC
ncbi:fungal-specific transcription factor domain-containing protein [Mycena vitilis]|nr:fungal-specific transcription factor domain-containing protein [Mycena vitilis]